MSKKNSKAILVIIGIGVLSLFIYRYFFLLPEIKKDGRYTIGVVIKNQHVMKNGGYKTYFSYYVSNIKYLNITNSNINDNPKFYINKKFLVTFLDFNHKRADISLSSPVPDSIKKAPSRGWKELPKWAK